jgi:hypothetical protein
MEQGKHVAIEVPAAMTLEEIWALVNTAERTRKHCMQLENCVYDFFELATLNMAQHGLFGDVHHVEGAYIHDLGRTNDGVDHEHGAAAVKYHFDKYADLWDKYGLTSTEREYIKLAVIQHSTREWTRLGEDGYDVMAILKDADALDRCRLGDLDPRWLRYPESRTLVSIIENIYRKTWDVNEDITLQEFCNNL